jgi:hypothetical protein
MQISKADNRGPSTRCALSGAYLLGAERCELGLGRKGFLRAVTGDREGGIARRVGERGLKGEAAGEIAGEAADEGVAGAGGVDHVRDYGVRQINVEETVVAVALGFVSINTARTKQQPNTNTTMRNFHIVFRSSSAASSAASLVV